jgi:hypothetical protein
MSFGYETEPLDEMEDVKGVFYGGRGQVGQQIVVTNRRLLLGPLNTKIAQHIDAYVLDAAAPGVGGLIKEVLADYGPMSAKTIWLRHVATVRSTGTPSGLARWFKPPGIEVVTDTAETLRLGIVVSPTTMNRDPRNVTARDQALAVLEAAVQAAKAAPDAT